MKFDVNTVITAAYNYTGGGSGGGGATYYTVKFKKGEHGSLLGNTSFSIRSGNQLTTVPAVDVDDGYEFAGWRSGSTTYTNEEVKNLKITKATTFTAQYKTITGNSGASDKNWSNALERMSILLISAVIRTERSNRPEILLVKRLLQFFSAC